MEDPLWKVGWSCQGPPSTSSFRNSDPALSQTLPGLPLPGQALGKMSSEVGFCPAKWKLGLPSCCRNVSWGLQREALTALEGLLVDPGSLPRPIIFRSMSLNYDREPGAVGVWRSPTKTFAHVFSICSLIFQLHGALNPIPSPAYYIFSVITVPSPAPTSASTRWVLALSSLHVWLCTA